MPTHQVAIVTGAGSGIGRQTAVRFASAGWSVVLVARTRAALDQTATLAQRLQSGGNRCVAIPADVTDPDRIHYVVDETIATFSRIDAVANVAGYAPMMPIDQTTPQLTQACIDTNLTSVINMTAAVWPTMVKQRSGVIVNVSSMASFDPYPGLSAYAAAKIGVNMFTQCTADEGKPHNIRAVAIAPGAVETPMLRALLDKDALPTDKTLDPDQIAELIVDCTTTQHPFTPGETIQIPSP